MDTGRSLAAQFPRAPRRCPRPPANNSGFARDFRVLGPLVTLADGLGALQHTPFRRLERVLGLLRLLVDFAGLGKPALRLVILARRGAVPLALVALLRTVRLFVFGHPDLRRFYHVLMRTGRRSPPLRTVAEIDRCWGAELVGFQSGDQRRCYFRRASTTRSRRRGDDGRTANTVDRKSTR